MTENHSISESDTWPAPTKLNLFLHVTGRRSDGYHDIQTLFQLLDWGDQLRIEVSSNGKIRRTGEDFGVPEQQDLAVRAARLLQAECAVNEGAEIQIDKHVPMGSGLGGGSSDAATVLLVLNRAWGCDCSLEDLAALGSGLGADVPVFVRGRSALASGIGDQLQPVELGSRHYVLVFPGFPVSTREVFTDPCLRRDSAILSPEQVLSGEGVNDCEAVVRQRYPAMAEALDKLAAWGRPVMTGTGSGIFIAMNDKKQAINAAREIKTLYNSRAVTGVDCSPVHRILYPDGI